MEGAVISVQRQAYDQAQFDKQFVKEAPPSPSQRQRFRHFFTNKLKCSTSCFLDNIFSFLPFIKVLKTYKWKKYAIRDIIAGLCVAVIHIPQSMGFAVIASLPPFYGLYSSLFPVLVYFLFGTSRHLSVGTMAIISIMIGSIVEKESLNFLPHTSLNMVNATQTEIEKARIDFSVDIATSVTLLVGLIQFGMGVVRLGVLATFMSLSFIGGFMTGAAFHIATSQVPFMLGIKIPRQVGIFRLPKNWYWICRYIPETNITDLVISVICIAILVVSKDIINKRLKDKMKIPIPAELIVVVLGTIAAHFGNMKEKYSIQVVEKIPLGLPSPRAPSLHNGSAYAVDALAIAVVSYAISMSLAKSMGHKHRYAIDQNQELLAHGLMHAVSACFSCFAGAAAPPRTLVHDSSGGKTLVASLVSAALILLVCLVLGPLFEALPYSVLGSICTVAIFPLFEQFRDLPRIWRLNKYDFSVWILTFLSVVTLDVDYGLYVGMGVSLLTLVAETHRAKGDLLTQVERTEVYMPSILCRKREAEQRNIAVFTFKSPLYFANVDSFKRQLYEKTLNPITHLQGKYGLPNHMKDELGFTNELSEPATNGDQEANGSTVFNTSDMVTASPPEPSLVGTSRSQASSDSVGDLPTVHPWCIVLDCSAITYADIMGLNTLKQICADYSSCGIYLVFANCSQELRRKMTVNGTNVGKQIFPSIADAIACMTEARKKKSLSLKF